MCGFSYSSWSILTEEQFHQAFMSSKLERRGGDGTSIKRISETEICGHTLFSVTGKQPVRQPIEFRDGVLLFNGEIYNYRELATEYQLQIEDSDTLLLRELINLMGFERALQLLDGAFAILMVDTSTRVVKLARDRWGQKPIYYSQTNEGLLVSSSFQFVEGLVGQRRGKSASEIFKLFGFMPGALTLNPDIYKVLPGTILAIGEDGTQTRTDFGARKSADANIERALRKSILQTLPRDKFALAFSGGIDSSLIFAVIRECNKDIPVLHLNITKNKHETQNARALANFFAEELQEFSPYACYSTTDALEGLCDHPVLNAGILGTASVAKYARDAGYRVLITGMGSDEYFGGYARAKSITQVSGVRLTGAPFTALVASHGLPTKIRMMLFCIFWLSKASKTRVILAFLLLRSSASRRALLKSFLTVRGSLNDFAKDLPDYGDVSLADALVRFERWYVMPEYMAAPLDMVAQSLGIEVRSPFFANEIDSIFEESPLSLYSQHKQEFVSYLENATPFINREKERFGVL